MFPNVLVQVRRSFVKLAASDRRADEIDAAANNQIDVGDVGDAVGWMRRCGSRQSGLKLEAASAMGELESRTGLSNVSRHSDGGGGRLGAREGDSAEISATP